MLPFTRDQFLAVFGQYNVDLWPLQVLAYAVGVAAVVAVFRPAPMSGRLIAGALALMWLWTGAAYHGFYFSAINDAALLFAALFVVQAALLLHIGAIRGQLEFGPPHSLTGWLGAALAFYAAILYPLIGMATGHHYPDMPMFGLTPCPVVLFTFGLLLLATRPVSRWLLAVPLLWSFIGGSAAFLLGMPQDWPLLAAGLLAGPMLVLQDRNRRKATP